MNQQAATPGRHSINVQIGLSSIPTGVSPFSGGVRKWLFNAPDAKVFRAELTIQYASGVTPPGTLTGVRGKFVVYLTEQVDARTFVNVTQPKELRSMEGGRFVLGDATRRLTPGRMVFLQIEYSAVTVTTGEPVFWLGAEAINITVQLEP